MYKGCVLFGMSPVVLFTRYSNSLLAFSDFKEVARSRSYSLDLMQHGKNQNMKERQEGNGLSVKCLNYIQSSLLKTVNIWSDLGG